MQTRANPSFIVLRSGLGLLLLALLAGCSSSAERAWWAADKVRMDKGRAIFQEKCKTDAGEKIYRKVEEVEGIVLLKVREWRSEVQWFDKMWPGAAFARESHNNGYIENFLGYEHSGSPERKPVTQEYRGYINLEYNPKNPSNAPGYRFVDVMQADGGRLRYTIVKRPRPTSQIGWIDTLIEGKPTTAPAPRYAVTFEDHVDPALRELWLASSTVKVIDLQTQEVLGELKRWAWAYEPAPGDDSIPWGRSRVCPQGDNYSGNAVTRMFVDRILIPKKAQ
ncbi:hypothetical protein [Parachitinimonas caeni]|uniref:Lipoprotein n=1 Tax=Parachitinimonas caeni TaxID=3031301 RepID=A0ABT7E0I6_9NEIS|nr:hypothetical protein [Parachitinimonas caeni]MDK2125822.1 hypothetical protein [Parachitinimonas caeni]